jgi:ribonuclease R
VIACEVVRRGRFLAADPYFEPGHPLALGKVAGHQPPPGELVLVDPSPDGTRGRVVARFGSPRDIRAVLHALAAEGGAARPFPPPVEAEAGALPADPGPPSGDRRDLRGDVAFTVDPGSAKDHDDAIAVVRDGAGFVVRVHIADVAAAVPAGRAIDREARLRGFSCYLPGRVDPMLPPALSAGLCSLLPERPRDVVTVEVPFSSALDPGAPSVYRSQIVSRRRFAYEQVEAILAGAASELREPLTDAHAIATRLRAGRAARGALMLELGERELTIGDGFVVSARTIAEPVAHTIVEELMILANEVVATRLAAQDPRRAPFRAHDPPQAESVERLYAQLDDLGVPTPPLEPVLGPTAAARAVAAAAAAAARFARSRRVSGTGWALLVLRAVQQARYTLAATAHSGVGSEAYCHFTSPIRRYRDLLVHRALLGIETGATEQAAIELSEREREWEALERRGEAVALATLCEPGEEYDGEVVGLIAAGLFLRFGDVFEGFLPARRLGRRGFEPNALQTALDGPDGLRFRLGDRMRVRVDSTDARRGRISLAPVSSG